MCGTRSLARSLVFPWDPCTHGGLEPARPPLEDDKVIFGWEKVPGSPAVGTVLVASFEAGLRPGPRAGCLLGSGVRVCRASPRGRSPSQILAGVFFNCKAGEFQAREDCQVSECQRSPCSWRPSTRAPRDCTPGERAARSWSHPGPAGTTQP